MKTRIAVVFLVLLVVTMAALLGWFRGSGRPATAPSPGRRATLVDRNGVVLARDRYATDRATNSHPARSARPEASSAGWWREYPLGETLANVVGFVGSAGSGSAGLELSRDSLIRRKTLARSVVRLTLDVDLQRAAFRGLQQLVGETRAARGSAVAMDAGTGEVLALVDFPGYDLGRARTYPAEALRCHAVTEAFAPGAAGLGLLPGAEPDSDSRVVSAQRLGLGKLPGIGLPAEASGRLTESLPGIRVSLLQLCRAYAAIADGGILRDPRLLGAGQRNPGRQAVSRAFAGQALTTLAGNASSALPLPNVEGIAAPDDAGPVLVWIGLCPAGAPEFVVGVTVEQPLAGYYTPDTGQSLVLELSRRVVAR